MKRFRADIDPRGQGRPKAARRGRHATVYESDADQAWKHEFTMLTLRERPREPFAGPVAVTIRACKRLPKWRLWSPWRTVTPDADNVAKIVLDVMTSAQWWHDDRQVARLEVLSLWAKPGDRGHLEITVEQLDEAKG